MPGNGHVRRPPAHSRAIVSAQIRSRKPENQQVNATRHPLIRKREPSQVTRALTDAAEQAGLLEDEARRTISSGLSAGSGKPRDRRA